LSKVRDIPEEQGDFIIHLGDWGNSSSDRCSHNSYERIAQVYSNSIVPVFFVPGKREWNNCPDYEASQNMWKNAFVGFERKHWDMQLETRGYKVKRQETRTENFAFAFKDAVYIGLNLVAGNIWDHDEWDLRLDANIEWVEENVEENQDANLIVIFGSAGLIHKNDRFFIGLKEKSQIWADNGRESLQFLYVKQSATKMLYHNDANNMTNFSILNIESDRWPPTKLSLDTSRYKMTFDDESWFE